MTVKLFIQRRKAYIQPFSLRIRSHILASRVFKYSTLEILTVIEI